MPAPLKIGITGGIGSGKTTVANIFRTLGIPVYDADSRAKALMEEDPDLRQAIREAFGAEAYTPEGRLDRARMAERVFHDREQLEQLNALVHPVVGRDAEAWHQRQRGVPYTLKEAALLFESGSFQNLDMIIVVTAPEALRLERVMARDQADEESIRARMANQWSPAEKLERADIHIYNDGRRPLLPQVLATHQMLCRKAGAAVAEPHLDRVSSGEIVIQDWESFLRRAETTRSLVHCTLRGIDFRGREVDWPAWTIEDTCFLGCILDPGAAQQLRQAGAYLYNAPDNLPYRPFRKSLYTWRELLEGFQPGQSDLSRDLMIYQHFSATRTHPPVNEALWQRIHDHAIDDGLRRLLRFNSDGLSDRKGVGVMGGHGTSRADPFFRRTAETTRLLTRAGYFVVSGGGPGIMEAANFGAYLAPYSDADFERCLDLLMQAPEFHHPEYYPRAFEVLNLFPEGTESLAIPTWFYGHEPSNVFATHIAKYFSNSLREDTLLAIALYGIVFAPGSAGTTQEIFMDATQNHYGTFHYVSPMVFLGTRRYREETMIYPLVEQLSAGQAYGEMLCLTDEPEEVLAFLQAHPPRLPR